ncbi:MAG: type II toxin-antitoxin system VapC family toxin [Acidimicrobiales bacterium]
MARLLILDAEAVSALANPTDRGATRLRAAAITSRSRQDNATIAVPLPVLAETYRGTGPDASIDRLVNLLEVVPLTLPIARLAGQLRATAGRGSAVDAMVVATAVRLGGALITTADKTDLTSLAQNHPNMKIWSLQLEQVSPSTTSRPTTRAQYNPSLHPSTHALPLQCPHDRGPMHPILSPDAHCSTGTARRT